MKPQYKDHLTEWRPDYPPEFYVAVYDFVVDVPERASDKKGSVDAFTIARDAISKAISSQH